MHDDDLVAEAFLAALQDDGTEVLRGLLAPDVWFRALLPRGSVEVGERSAAVGWLQEWFMTPLEKQIVGSFHRAAVGRLLVGYRFRLRPAWAPDVWHVVEQTAHLRVANGVIRRLDILCTGFHPAHRAG